jgi:hypothetical protein
MNDNMKDNSNRKINRNVKASAPATLREQIEMRAYQIWLASGGADGNAFQHWLQAEAEILKATEAQTGPSSER